MNPDENDDPREDWSEAESAQFIDYGDAIVPARERQIETICDLMPEARGTLRVAELCCGEGRLSEALLSRIEGVHVTLFDGSESMLQAAASRLERFAGRFRTQSFDLADPAWRTFPEPLDAVVTSLAVHHLDGAEKRRLFADMARALAAGGVFVLADIVEPTTRQGMEIAARAWDAAVVERSRHVPSGADALAHFRASGWNYFADDEPDPIDKPSPLFDQLKWLEAAGLSDVDVLWMDAGHAILAGWKR